MPRTKEERREYQREYMRQWRENQANKDKEKAFRETHKRELAIKSHEQYERGGDTTKKRHLSYYYENREYFRKKAKERYERDKDLIRQRAFIQRMACLIHYGGDPPVCACCGEDTIEFLAIDHINNDGYKYRKAIKSSSLIRWIIANNYPEGLQVLCHNCNMAKAFYGQCPHTVERLKAQPGIQKGLE